MKASTAALRFLAGLCVPEGPRSGKPLKLAPFQKAFVRGALAAETATAVLSIGRGNAKTALSSGIALGALVGEWDRQPKREILLAARTRDQAQIAWRFVAGLALSLPEDVQRGIIFRRAPRLEIEWEGDGGGHVVRAIAADGKSALGSAPTLAILDERGHWASDRGDELEHALLSGLGKRGGKALIISTSAPDDAHPFSRWIDDPQEGVFVQEHRPPPGLPADDRESLLIANPGAPYGIGADLAWLEAQGRRAIARGGSALTSFRLYNRNEMVSGEARDLLLLPDEWLACETSTLPERRGSVVIGIDLGGSASMSAAAFYWPETGRLEALATFPSLPSLLDRGQSDGVAGRYVEMQARGELSTLGEKTVPVAAWLAQVMRHVAGQPIAAVVADRFKQAELGEAMQRAGVTAPVGWRGMGFRDGGEDCERFRRAAFDGQVRSAPSLLLRSAFADTVCLRDPANNLKLAKAERARQAKRGRLLGEQRHAQLVAAVAAILRRGDPTPFRFEAGCIVALRRKLILAGGWYWRDADAAAREVTLDALREIGAKRPSWAEASTPHYAQADAFSLFERTRCRQCGGRLPEENRVHCSVRSRHAYGNALNYAEQTAFAAMAAEGL